MKNCENCGNESNRIEKHHVSYLPVIIKFLCVTCHKKTETQQPRLARILYSKKGVLLPKSKPNQSYGYDEKRDRAYPRFRFLTEKEKMIRKEMIK